MTESDLEPICSVEGSTVDVLVISDLHLRATGAQYPVADLVETHDIVLSSGDVVDENRDHAKSVSAGEAYEERAGHSLNVSMSREYQYSRYPGITTLSTAPGG